eukprot:2244867-Pyramimonas_sp.AAC.1
MKTEKSSFSNFSALASEAPFTRSEERCVRRELYEVPGGNLVDGLPPVPIGRPDCKRQCGNFGSVPRRALRQDELRGIRAQDGASSPTRP